MNDGGGGNKAETTATTIGRWIGIFLCVLIAAPILTALVMASYKACEAIIAWGLG